MAPTVRLDRTLEGGTLSEPLPLAKLMHANTPWYAPGAFADEDAWQLAHLVDAIASMRLAHDAEAVVLFPHADISSDGLFSGRLASDMRFTCSGLAECSSQGLPSNTTTGMGDESHTGQFLGNLLGGLSAGKQSKDDQK